MIKYKVRINIYEIGISFQFCELKCPKHYVRV